MKRNQGVTEESSVYESLEKLGLKPEDIHYVLMTHLHFDHASGLTKWEGSPCASFSKCESLRKRNRVE